MNERPAWLHPDSWLGRVHSAGPQQVRSAMAAATADAAEFAILLSDAAAEYLEPMAQHARSLTRRHFGKTINLYAPLYVSNYCPGGCAYCGFASDRQQRRHKLSHGDLLAEMRALKKMGIAELLLLTGERTPEADFGYLLSCVATAAEHFHNVTVESFAMTDDEYRRLALAGCTGVTLYQETYDPVAYDHMHRWGPKRDYAFRLDAPSRALRAGMRTVGIGALLALGDPIYDAIALYQHALHLRRTFWQGGVSISFPRVRPETGGFAHPHPVSERLLAQIVFGFRICLPDVPLVLSTRERPVFRDGMAGVGISKMSVASRTTVGGYDRGAAEDDGQFQISDTRDVEEFCRMLRSRDLEPVFKNWDAVYR